MPERARERVLQQMRVGKIRDSSLLHDRPLFEHSNAVRHAQRKLDIVRDEQHATAFVRERPEIVKRAHREIEVKTRRRLVCHDQLRTVHERTAEQDTPRHTAGQLVRVEVGNLGRQAIARKQLRLLFGTQKALFARPRHAAYLAADFHERVKMGRALGDKRHAPAAQARKPRRVLPYAVEPYTSFHQGVRLEHAHDGVCQQRFART